MGSVLRRALRLSRRERLFRPGDLVVVAVSGGQDSVCLLDVLVRLQATLELGIHVAHVNHGIRGKEAQEDARYVASLAERYGLPFTNLLVDVPAYRRKQRLSLQVAARYARYQLLARLAAQVGSVSVATGHTRDDLVETMLMNLIRGSGLRGLAGIEPEQELRRELLGPPVVEGPPRVVRVLRPLLEVERRETGAYCEAVGLTPRPDPSNALRTYLRNRVRAELVPLLERYNPSIRKTMAQSAAALRSDLEVVERAVQAAWERVARVEPGRVELEREMFLGEPAAIQRHLFRRAVLCLRGTTEGLSWQAVDDAVRVATRSGPGRRVSLPGGVEVTTGYQVFQVVLPTAAPAEQVLERAFLPLPGLLKLAELGDLETTLLEEPEAVSRARAELERGGPCEAWVDADKLGGPLEVRPRRPGDRMRPLGLGHARKVQDILVDAKVPRALRELLPVVESPSGIVWLAGLRLDERFAVDETTKRLGRLRFKPQGALALLCQR